MNVKPERYIVCVDDTNVSYLSYCPTAPRIEDVNRIKIIAITTIQYLENLLSRTQYKGINRNAEKCINAANVTHSKYRHKETPIYFNE